MKKIFISFATFVAASALMSSCSNDESTATTTDQLTVFTGGIVTEVPMERVQIGTSDSSTVVPGFTTRTSMNRDAIGGQGAFLWEPKDVIYVEDDNNQLCKGKSTITDAVARTTFLVDGSYTGKSQYDVYYCGTNTGAKKVVIAGSQTQSAFNNTKHFGVAGDCGVAKAAKATVAGKRGYSFNLQHKASYLCFLPYIPSQQERANYKLKSIEITSNNNISGTYDLTESGLSGTGNAKKITLNIGTDGKGLKLADQTTAAKSIKNSLYVVIAPGTRKLSVKYTVFDTKGNKVMTLTKNYKSHNFTTNGVCDIPVSLGSADLNGGHKNADVSDTVEEDKNVFRYSYSGHNYYMWDAAKNYWSGHEWDAAVPWQPIKNDDTNDGYPKSKSADGARWYHEGSGAFEASVNPLFKQLPNANEMAWYVLKGDARFDITSKTFDIVTQWEVFGTVYTYGIWLKKLSVIAQENNKKLAELKQKDPNGIDLRKSYKNYEVSLEKSRPSDSEIDNYFFLPALGGYFGGKLYSLGSWGGYYWSSSANPGNSNYAYYLSFDNNYLKVEAENGMPNGTGKGRGNGFVAQPFK